MSVNIILALLFALLIAVFAAQNSKPIVLQFLAYEWLTSVVVVIVGSAAVGGLTVGFLSMFRQVGLRVRAWEQQGQLRKVEQELEEARRQADQRKQEVSRLQGELEATRARLRQTETATSREQPPPAAANPPGDAGTSES